MLKFTNHSKDLSVQGKNLLSATKSGPTTKERRMFATFYFNLQFCFTLLALLANLILQPWTRYLEQNGVIQYIWTRKERFGICSCMFFNCYLQSPSSWKETRHQAMHPPKFEIFLILPNFLRSSVFRLSIILPSVLLNWF